MQGRKKYYLNVSSYKYKREYMKLYQPNIDKILNTYSNNNRDIIIESENLCPGGKRCKNYLIIMSLEQKIKELNDTVNQLTKIKEYSESNHNIDFTPMKTMENSKKDTFNEICNSFRNSGLKKKLNNSTRNSFGNNTLQPQISEPYRLKLDFKNNRNENKAIENKKMNGKKLTNLAPNKFKNIGIALNPEKLKLNEDNNEIKNNNINYDEKEKKIQNLLNHIFNNKNNESLINKKLEEIKNKDINNKKGETKTMRKINIPKIKVKPYNLIIPNKINKTKNKRYISDLTENENKIEKEDENKIYFRKFKGELRNSFNNTKNKILSKSLGFNNTLKEEKNNLFNFTDKNAKTVSEDKKQSLYKLSLLNSFRPVTHNQKPFRLKLDISQNNDYLNKEKAKSERKIKSLENLDNKILLSDNINQYDFEAFLNMFKNKNEENYILFEEIFHLSNNNYEEILEILKLKNKEKINNYIIFIKHALIFIKDFSEIFNKLKLLYNITNSSESIITTQKDKSSFNEEIIKFKYNIKKSLAIDSIHIYIYDLNSDLLILKGENEEIKYPKDKDLIGKCFMSGKPLKYIWNENNSIKSFNKDDYIFIYPIKDLENNIYGVIEAINNNFSNYNSEKNYDLNKNEEIIMPFISKILGTMCIYYNYIK